MGDISRRGFAGFSLAGFALAGMAAPRAALAAAQCVASPRQPFLPSMLLIDCASRRNFQLFRQYSDYVGLAGLVSMTSVQGAKGGYSAGSMLLFPWLKPAGRKLRRSALIAACPTGPSTSVSAAPIPGSNLPPDEYFCRLVLKAPWQGFIGFGVDTPYTADQTRLGWCSNLGKLADGKDAGVDWTSSNLNRAWFGGSNVIPDQKTCDGDAWRLLISTALNKASSSAC